jgi:hypothetical protein
MIRHRRARALLALARRFAANRDGAITVEFVIIFPLLVALLFLIIFTSLLISTASDVQQVAHELARESLGRLSRGELIADLCVDMASDAELMDRLVTESLLLDEEKLNVLPCPGEPGEDGLVTLTVTYDFAGSTVSALGQNLGVTIGTITRTSIVRP